MSKLSKLSEYLNGLIVVLPVEALGGPESFLVILASEGEIAYSFI